MRAVRRLLYRDIVGSVGFVAAGFLALFFFIDLVDKLDSIGRRGRTTTTALLEALFELPGRAYELMPIAVLIGAIFSLARLAQNSEFTILRTGGLGPRRALVLLAWLGMGFALVTFVIGDAIVPAAERQAVQVRAVAAGVVEPARAGAWLRDRRREDGREIAVSVNVGSAEVDGTLRDLRIFEFDDTGRLVRRIGAERGRVGDGSWELQAAQTLAWPTTADGSRVQLELRHDEHLAWPTGLGAGVVAAALMPDETMTTLALWRYASHLEQQQQTSQRQQQMFWRRAFYPLSCIVMMALALPFAYTHDRMGGVSLKVFLGVMLGVTFHLLNGLFSNLGVINAWPPVVAALTPSLLFVCAAGMMLWWVERR